MYKHAVGISGAISGLIEFDLNLYGGFYFYTIIKLVILQ